VTDIDGLDLTPQQRGALRRADENPEHLTAHDAGVLGGLLAEGDEGIRRAILLTLVRGDPPASALAELVDALLTALDDDNLVVRQRAAELLGEAGANAPGAATDIVGPLVGTQGDDWSSVREASVTALGELGAADPERFDVVEPLITGLDDADAEVRGAAAESLWMAGAAAPRTEHDLVGPLTTALDDPESRVRLRAAEALGRIGEADTGVVTVAVGPLATALDDPEHRVRERAASALGRIGAEDPDVVADAVGALIGSLDDDGGLVQSRVAKALGRIGAEDPGAVTDAIEPLTHLLDARGASVRREAMTALARIGAAAPEAVVPVTDSLLDALEDDRHTVRRHACRALGHVTPAGSNDEVVAAADALYRVLSDDDDDVREAAAVAVGRLVADVRDREDVSGIQERLDDRLDGRPIDLIGERLDDPCTNVAIAAAFTVFRTGVVDHELRATARGRLREGLTEYEWPLLTSRLVAELAANGPVVHPMMREVFYDDEGDGNPAVRDLVPDLVQLFDHPDSNVRRHACRALGHLDATAAAADLERVAAEDERATVRKAAAAALDRIETTTAPGDEADADPERAPEPGDAAPADPAESDEPAAVAPDDTTPTPTDEEEPDAVPTDEAGEPAGSLADRAALYSRLLEYARAESFHECRRWAEELHRFVEANPVDGEGYAAAREEAAALVEDRLPNEREVFGNDHALVTGDRSLADVAPELHEDIGDVAFAVRRCYVRGE
jgi:HEAT repeat protein